MTSIEKVIEVLDDITYTDWIKIRTATDKAFQKKIREFESNVKLSNSVHEIKELIQSQFGQKLD